MHIYVLTNNVSLFTSLSSSSCSTTITGDAELAHSLHHLYQLAALRSGGTGTAELSLSVYSIEEKHIVKKRYSISTSTCIYT